MFLLLDVSVLVGFHSLLDVKLLFIYYVCILNYYHLGNSVPIDLCFGIWEIWFANLVYQKDFYLPWG